MIVNQIDGLVKNQIYHREHGAHRDNQLIKQDVLCVLCEFCGEKGFFTTPSKLLRDTIYKMVAITY